MISLTKRLALPIIIVAVSACGDNNDTPAPPIEPVNQAPIANAGNDISVDEQTSVTLTGQGTDSDGTVASYLWQQTAGTQVTLINTDKAQTSFTAPDINTNETLTFSLTVTDNEGASNIDEVSIEVLHVNILPKANAGEDVQVDEETTVHLLGSGVDTDGYITSYSWRQITDKEVTITGEDQADLKVSLPNFQQDEILSFELTVADNSGTTHSDTVIITVKNLTWQPNEVQLIDINNDGTLDMLVKQLSNGESRKITWRKGLINGTFDSEQVISRYVKAELIEYYLDDINGDAITDMFVKYKTAEQTYLTWHKGIANNTFSSELSILSYPNDDTVRSSNRSYGFGLFTNDTRKDLILLTETGVDLYQQLENDEFSAPQTITADWSIEQDGSLTDETKSYLPEDIIKVEDFNGDGLADLVFSSIQAVGEEPSNDILLKKLAISYNSNGKKLLPPSTILSNSVFATYSYFSAYATEDINNDGILDIIVEDYNYNYDSQSTSIAYRWHNLAADTPKSYGILSGYALDGLEVTRLNKFDWNEDGETDYFISSYDFVDGTQASIALGQGNGLFDYSGLIENIQTFRRADIDIDFDGIEDLLQWGLGTVEWQKKGISKVFSEYTEQLFSYQGEMLGPYDFDQDQKIDFFSWSDNTLYWYRNQGDFTFTEHKTSITE